MPFLDLPWSKHRSKKSQRRSRSRNSNRSTASDAEGPPASEENRLSFRIGAQDASDAAFTVLKAAGGLAPVPGLSTAAGLVQQIAQLCLNVARNRNEASLLSSECCSLQKTIEETNESGQGSERMEKLIQEFISLLEEIETSMTGWSKLDFWKSLLYQFQISDDIETYGRRLRNMITNFGVRWSNDPNVKDRLSRIYTERPEDALRELSDPGIADNLREMASHARSNGESGDVADVMTQVVKGIDDAGLTFNEREQLERNLFIMSEAAGEIPKELRIPASMLKFDGRSIGGSANYDIYQGKYLSWIVAIKKARAIACTPESVKHIIKEAKNWKTACESDPHEEYILHLIGVSFFDDSFVMVSRWMDDRDAFTYICLHGESVDRRDMVRRIGKGLEILHSRDPPIAHGHLKASNIMINHKGEPLLGDFGLSKSLKNITGQPMTDIKGFDSFRWFAPETLGGDTLISKESDIYSFGMTVLEIMTSAVPYREIKKAMNVSTVVKEGRHPDRPTEDIIVRRGLDKGLWALLLQCWEATPSRRPSIFDVNNTLGTLWP
ncbi:kinase-like protein [Schizopora paradoxa]|uniref:Kinase-like protein n=1 Tax=Schizopora paradoxa TaxID=27342 RepID=A0A0H2RGM0_9AGAM|nr:kinase-like protein [Schizopora paradoxa]